MIKNAAILDVDSVNHQPAGKVQPVNVDKWIRAACVCGPVKKCSIYVVKIPSRYELAFTLSKVNMGPH